MSKSPLAVHFEGNSGEKKNQTKEQKFMLFSFL